MLAQFDESCETVVECDASGWATGGALMQYDTEGIASSGFLLPRPFGKM